jgi:hypothetical protein
VINRGRRYQVSESHAAGAWQVLDMYTRSEDGKHPIAAIEIGREAARKKARELNAAENAKHGGHGKAM